MNIEIPTNLSESASAEIQAIIDREKAKVGAFVPKDGEMYWYNTFWGCETAVWGGSYRDRERFIFGNYFPTADAARAADTAYCAKFDAQYALAAAPAYLAKLDAQYAIARWLAEHQEWLATEEEGANPSAMKFHVIHRRKEGRSVLVVKGWSSFEPLGVASFREHEYADQFIADCGDHLRVVHGLPREGK